MQEVTLEIDGMKVTIEDGKTVLEAARKAGIPIPTLCYHEELEPFGACRFCMVEITKGKRKRLVASCVYPAEDGLIVKTNTERVREIRRMILELLLPIAPAGPLRELAKRYGVEKSRFQSDEIRPTHCTLCGMCVRYCNEVMKYDAVSFVGRGVYKAVALTPEAWDLCVFCRKCYTICEAGRFPMLAEEYSI